MVLCQVIQTHFRLGQVVWDAFSTALVAPPHELPRLRELLATPCVFNEPG